MHNQRKRGRCQHRACHGWYEEFAFPLRGKRFTKGKHGSFAYKPEGLSTTDPGRRGLMRVCGKSKNTGDPDRSARQLTSNPNIFRSRTAQFARDLSR